MIDTIWKTFTGVLGGKFPGTGHVRGGPRRGPSRGAVSAEVINDQSLDGVLGALPPDLGAAPFLLWCQLDYLRHVSDICTLCMKWGRWPHHVCINKLPTESVFLQWSQMPSPWVTVLHTFRNPDLNSWR